MSFFRSIFRDPFSFDNEGADQAATVFGLHATAARAVTMATTCALKATNPTRRAMTRTATR
jgi:hypothetical protein